ncbi:MAG: hypothetical protein OEV66_04375 [Spirochaetia bacterium]|nr:hypothetical protein [Spirochaetia bacterium]
MTEHLNLIVRQLTHLQRMREYLAHFVNHEYKEDADRLTQLFMEMIKATPERFDFHKKLLNFCRDAYGVKPVR